MLEPFRLPFVQVGVVEVLALAVAGGVLGTWIVLRGLAFYAHAAGTVAFPGLVLASGLGFAPQLGALAAATALVGGVGRLSRQRHAGYDSATALVLVGCLAAGVILASDVFHSAASVETLLFGSLLAVEPRDVAFALVAAVAALVASVLLGRRWLTAGFDPAAARAIGLRSPAPDAVLLAVIALGVVSALSAVGALLATAVFVVPAATARLVTRRMASWQAASVALAAGEGVLGLWLSVRLNAPAGATIATLSGVGFAVVALARAAGPRLRAAAALAGVVTAAAGCGGLAGAPPGQRLEVVATTTQLADLARQVGGGATSVHQLLAPNTDPHDYEPRPADAQAIAGARIVFRSGDGLDDWVGKLVSQAGDRAEVVDLGATVPVKRPAIGGAGSGTDPHWWHDPVNAEAAVRRLREAIVAAAPARRAAVDRRAAAYLTRLRELDRAIRRCVDAVPAGRRRLVTDHDAFGYFAARYGIDVVGAVIPASTTQAQPSARDVARLAALIRRRHVPAIFPETSASARLVRAVARQTGATVGRSLYGDTLGPRGSPAATYLGMEAANADAIVRGLTGGRRGCAIPRMR